MKKPRVKNCIFDSRNSDVQFHNEEGMTTEKLDTDAALKRAVGKLSGVVILGYDEDGDEYIDSSIKDGGDVLWLLESAKLKMMCGVDD